MTTIISNHCVHRPHIYHFHAIGIRKSLFHVLLSTSCALQFHFPRDLPICRLDAFCQRLRSLYRTNVQTVPSDCDISITTNFPFFFRCVVVSDAIGRMPQKMVVHDIVWSLLENVFFGCNRHSCSRCISVSGVNAILMHVRSFERQI